MLKICVTKKNDNIVSLEVKGHAGYADEGKDIVCAAVSAVVQTTAMAIQKNGLGTYKSSEGHLKISIDEHLSHDSQLLLSSAIDGLKDIMSGYPKNIKMEDKIL